MEALRKAYHTTKAAKEIQAATPLLTTPINSPRTSDEEGEGEGDSCSSPSSPQCEGGEGERERVHFEALHSVVFEGKEEGRKVDETPVEVSDKGRE